MLQEPLLGAHPLDLVQKMAVDNKKNKVTRTLQLIWYILSGTLNITTKQTTHFYEVFSALLKKEDPSYSQTLQNNFSKTLNKSTKRNDLLVWFT